MALDDVINPPSATGGVSQSDPESIARSLVGNALVDKFGHAMGVRPTTEADVMRDAYLGMTVGPANVTKMQAQAQKALQDEHARSLAQGLAQQQAARQKMQTMIAGLKTVMDPKVVPISQRARAWSSLMTAAGYPPDKDVVAMLTDKTDPDSRKNMDLLLKAAPNMSPDEFGAYQQTMEGFLGLKKDMVAIDATKQATANAVVTNALNAKRLERLDSQPTPETPRERDARAYHRWLMEQQEPVLDANGNPKVDENGKPVKRLMSVESADRRMKALYPDLHGSSPLAAGDEAAPPAAAPAGGVPFLGSRSSTPSSGGSVTSAATTTAPILGMPDATDLSVPNQRGVVKLKGGTATPLP